jgi:hypothetical protein
MTVGCRTRANFASDKKAPSCRLVSRCFAMVWLLRVRENFPDGDNENKCFFQPTVSVFGHQQSAKSNAARGKSGSGECELRRLSALSLVVQPVLRADAALHYKRCFSSMACSNEEKETQKQDACVESLARLCWRCISFELAARIPSSI